MTKEELRTICKKYNLEEMEENNYIISQKILDRFSNYTIGIYHKNKLYKCPIIKDNGFNIYQNIYQQYVEKLEIDIGLIKKEEIEEYISNQIKIVKEYLIDNRKKEIENDF